MDRRKALRNMGMAMGYTVATPTLISLMQGCKTEPAMTWEPDFFTKDQGAALLKLVDIVLPKTDTPSASEMQVHLFLDRFAAEAMEPKKRDFLKLTTEKFMQKALTESGSETLADVDAEALEKVFGGLLKISKEDREANFEALQKYEEGVAAEDSSVLLDDTVASFAFANTVRDMSIWGYKTSEYVGEEVLAYLPIPGEYVGCGDVQELTGGKAWSL
ncbi:gluconate 2-dehydrogenase subunit 3 family protein [Maribacter sp. 2-571]|uniref:gluconate 2-dehydrogenase subunit 3 family protein n=1 Tax=Maribacter sp. 2-571 TaxID=3417569 RepID=UPI003D34FBC1